MSPALEVRNLSFGYGRRESVHAVSLSLDAGDCYGFLGHNGAGKTTVLRLCLGLMRPRSGSIRIHGVDALRHPRQARAGTGALVERPGFHLHAKAHTNLLSLARLQGMPRALAAAESWRVLELLGLSKAANQPVGSFSLGMRQRLGIAQALLGKPKLLLLDEPINGLDPEGIADVRNLLRHLSRDEGVAVLLSSHQLQELEDLCTRIGVLREGAMVLEGSLDELRRDARQRTIVQGTPLAAMETALRELGLAPERAHDRLAVELAGHPAGAVTRALTRAGELIAFQPEPVTLESIYLRASQQPAATPSPAAQLSTETPAPQPVPMPGAHMAGRPRLRAFGHELRMLLARPTTRLLFALPAAVAVASAFSYRTKVQAALALVASKEKFSADSGSGHLAAAHALEAATPIFAACLLWLGSQSIAADLQRDTLRNTVIRSVRRSDVLIGKLAALATFAIAGWVCVAVAALVTAASLFGLGNLEEITRTGGRQPLAMAADVAPMFTAALLWTLPPLLATAALGLCASALARRPARALALALLLALGPELVHTSLRERAGWLLTSHLPTPLRDDSVLGYFEAIARGAADANWAYESQALTAPIAWLVLAVTTAALVLRRLRIP